MVHKEKWQYDYQSTMSILNPSGPGEQPGEEEGIGGGGGGRRKA